MPAPADGLMPAAARVVRAECMPAGTPAVAVAIVGAGACGLVAALGLRDAGVEALLLERDAQAQGSTALSSGFIPAACTRVQAAAGVLDDSAERFAAEIQAKARGRAAPALVAAYSRAIGGVIDDLQARHGLDFELLDGFLYPGHSRRRMHSLAQRSGAALVAALAAAAERAGASVLTQARVEELWCDRTDRVIGLACRRPDGSLEQLGCQALILACNGFGGNPAMVRQHLPEMVDAVYAGHAGNDGAAITWGQQLGAALADLGGYQGHGGWAVPQGALITWALMVNGGIQVNAAGRRFHDETAGYSEAAVQVLAQPGGLAWMVFDAPLLALGQGFPDFVAAQAAGAVRSAADAAALADLIGCPPAPLTETLAGSGLAPPWHAIRVSGALFHTQGGLDIDADCRVLRPDGSALPNLWAAGGAARGVSGNAVWGYLSGNGLLSAMAGGAIAARSVRNQLGNQP